MENKPTYYAVLTADVRYNKDLSSNAKLLYAEITALTQSTGKCWASDTYFSSLYGVTVRTIQRWLRELEKNNHIKREVVYKEDSKEVEKRYITINNMVVTEMSWGYRQKCHGGTDKSVVDNTTSINTTSTNKVHMSNSKEKIPYKEIIEHLNKVTNNNYNANTSSYKTIIKKQWDKGYRLKDFKHVIDVKSQQWLNREWEFRGQMIQGNNLLNVKKLFGKDFDEHLNQKKVKKTKGNNPFSKDYDNADRYSGKVKEKKELTDSEIKQLENEWQELGF